MKSLPSVSVIIPVYNEVRTVASVVEIVRTWPAAPEIIVVDDGSTDGTAEALNAVGERITLITLPRNRGKSAAVSYGIKACHGDVVMLLDSDLVGLTHASLDKLVRTFVSRKADMVLGCAEFWSVGKFAPFDHLTGQRVMRRSDLVPVLDQIAGYGYGLELFLNDYFGTKRVVSVRMNHVYIVGKWEKQSVPDAVRSYLIETRDLLTQLTRQYAGDIPPHIRKIIRTITRYLLQVGDYLQQ